MAFLHAPDTAASATARVGVVLCPPFGWDEVASYRARRRWAVDLAEAGHPTVRIDLPGTGDSGGVPTDPDRLGAWLEGVSGAASWLRDAAQCRRIVAIGLGLGGLLAHRVAAAGGPVDDLVLWNVPSQGRRLVRELRAFSQFTASQFADPHAVEPPPLPEGWLEAGGFVLTGETVAALEGLDLAADPLPDARGRRVLLLTRDGRVDERLRRSLDEGGVDLAVEDGEGWDAMVTNPQLSFPPRTVIDLSIRWLAESSAEADVAPAAGAPPAAMDQAMLDVDGTPVVESTVTIEHEGRSLFGVLTEPVREARTPLTAVLLNAAAIRRIGPNRMWVLAARRWAAQGVPTLRLDLGGLGDSEGEDRAYAADRSFYTDDGLTLQVLAALDALEDRGLGDRFVLAGLCSGAYVGFHAALRDERVVATFLLNLWTFFWKEHNNAEREARRVAALVRRGGLQWLRVVTPRRVWRVLRSLPSRVRMALRRGSADESLQDVGIALDRLRARGTATLLVFSRTEPLLDDFERGGYLDGLAEDPGVSVEEIPTRDHTFRATWAQEQVHRALDEALERVIRMRPPADRAGDSSALGHHAAR